MNSFNPELKIKDNESTIKNKLKKSLSELRGFKFVTTLALVIKKIEIEQKKNKILHSKTETIINKNHIDDIIFKSIFATVTSNIQNLGKGSDRIDDLVV